MRLRVPVALTALSILVGCRADGDARGSTGGSSTASGAGGAVCTAESPADCCLVDADCKRTCAAGALCRCAIRHDQPGHCYADCPLEESQVTLGAECSDYSPLSGCIYGPDGKLGPSTGVCGYYCWRYGWLFIDCDFAATCARTGGTPSSDACCGDATDFPSTCPDFNQCGCDKSGDTVQVTVCQCPAGMCFDRVDGCHVPAIE